MVDHIPVFIPNHSITSLSDIELGSSIINILNQTLVELNPSTLIGNYFQESAPSEEFTSIINDTNFAHLHVISIGKSAIPMYSSFLKIAGDKVNQSIVITKIGHVPAHVIPNNTELIRSTHPIPDKTSLYAGERLLKFLKNISQDDLVIILVSGGGSSLITLPNEGISLEDLIKTNRILINNDLSINEINTIRKHLERLKGGRLVQCISPTRIFSLILSDVIGDDISCISSGPTSPDSSTYADSLEIIRNYDLNNQLPPNVIKYLQEGSQGMHPETPGKNDSIFRQVSNHIIGNNKMAMRTLAQNCRLYGIHPILISKPITGNVRSECLNLVTKGLDYLRDSNIQKPFCIIQGGEPTVQVTGAGSGGRCQEFALVGVKLLSGISNCALLTLATDGGDGLTDASGAVVTGNSYKRALNIGMNPADYLDDNDSYTFFNHLGDQVRTGPTLTNLNDLFMFFAY